MKFGKEYQKVLESPAFPPEWRQTAIEYRKLKKVINRVALELQDLGLTSEVLRDLLEKRSHQPGGTVEELVPTGEKGGRSEGMEFLREQEGSSEDEEGITHLSDKAKGKRKAEKRRARASYEFAGTGENPEPRIRLIFSSASSGSISESSGDEGGHPLLHRHSTDTDPSAHSSTSNVRLEEIRSSEEESVTAPTPEVEDDSASAHSELDEFVDSGLQESGLLKRMYGMGGEQEWEKMGIEIDPRRLRKESMETLRWVKLDGESADGASEQGRPERCLSPETGNDRGAEADDESVSSRPTKTSHRRYRHRQHRKEVFIPLNSDTEFLTLLAQALSSIAALQLAQKLQFAASVELLAREVSKVSSPSRPRTDLYIWREIFSLWVESQIFESQREKDRGERSVEDAQEKLEWFVDQVAVRKLAKRMKHKESRAALEKFVKLNVDLLDMKRFQMANEEAARKILKKHDKRTALTASQGFPLFIAAASKLSSSTSTEVVASSSTASTPRVLILPGFPSLPHILLSTVTNTLLPIIPQLEDYECAICGDLAFKPIRLACSHKFCVRCLVKLQKRGQDACPHCRSPVVLAANATNLDAAMERYLKLWFPKEVKAKANANAEEAGREELEEMGITPGKCIVS